jgi:hypothetical protein
VPGDWQPARRAARRSSATSGALRCRSRRALRRRAPSGDSATCQRPVLSRRPASSRTRRDCFADRRTSTVRRQVRRSAASASTRQLLSLTTRG